MRYVVETYKKNKIVGSIVWRNTKITKEEKSNINSLYASGMSSREIIKLTGFSSSTISKYLTNTRKSSEAILLSWSRHKDKIMTDKYLATVSENGKKACQNIGKYWTRPELEFKKVLNSINIGVKFPSFIKESKGIQDDSNFLCLCYQFPIQRYVVDFADIERKIVINVNGDYWHANPLLYKQDNLGKLQKSNVRQDGNKRKYLESIGWIVVDIWESEIYWNKDLVLEKLRAVGITETHVPYTDESWVQLPHRLPLYEDWSATVKGLWFKSAKNVSRKKELITVVCANESCLKKFKTKNLGSKTHKFCSALCSHFSHRKVQKPSLDELKNLMKSNPMTTLGKMFGVSDNAVRKWAKSYGLI